jgi:trigger factor
MEITLENIDQVNAVIKINLTREDYSVNVENSLKKFRQKADFPGFRKGMVPMGMIKKKYGPSVLLEEINKILSENVNAYIKTNHLNILGEPILNESTVPSVDVDTQEKFEFCFDIALSPELNVKLTKQDQLSYYTITVGDTLLDAQINSYKSDFGTYKQINELGKDDILKGTLTEWENDAPKTDGLVIEDAVLMPLHIKDKDEAAKFDQVKTGDAIVFNPSKAYEGNEVEIASFLKIKEEDAEKYTGDFSFEIKEICRYEEAELNRELFDKIFPEAGITTETDFREKLRSALSAQYVPNSNNKFLLDFCKLIDEKTKDVLFPESFIKRWMLLSNNNYTDESLEEAYPEFRETLKFRIVKEQLIKEYNLSINETEIIEHAKQIVKNKFAQYGIVSVPESTVDTYSQDVFKDKNVLQNVMGQIMETKLIACIQELINVEYKEISSTEFFQPAK